MLRSHATTVVWTLCSTSPNHYLNAGQASISYFQHLLNLIVKDVNLAILEELNAVWAIMLHKGQGKPRRKAKSWRCISSCPLVSKAIHSCAKWPQRGMCWGHSPNSVHGARQFTWMLHPYGNWNHHIQHCCAEIDYSFYLPGQRGSLWFC